MMHMTFYWGRQVTVLFDEWRTHTWLAYSLTLIAVFLFAALHEYVVYLRSRFVKASQAESASGLTTPLLRQQRTVKSKLMESVLFGVNAALGYLLMLAVMSFNGGVFIAVVLGFVAGYFFFRIDGKDEEITEDGACGCA